ncbi:MAG: (Fe-S)-binding protein [Fimbriimonadaceae bacterium]|nr:(Fe-S)-binding protein [Chthonomonadaceae bacterium]MCO5296133.1 (Fe-S)-binding protein [Fimbriimonadaceae bacterium]
MSELSELTTHCIRCGFCLEACPTFVLTGRETESPRGRIYLARSADEGALPWDDGVRKHLDTCLGCRACETACPSGVQYGQILELARHRLETSHPRRVQAALVDTVANPTLLRVQLLLGRVFGGRRMPHWVSRLLSGEAPEADLPQAQPTGDWPKLEAAGLPPVKGRVYLLEGCAMRVLYPRVHEATRRLLRRVGYEVEPAPKAGCCGALHVHGGFLGRALDMATLLMQNMPKELPVIVNAAGCGSFLKELGTVAGHAVGGHLEPDLTKPVEGPFRQYLKRAEQTGDPGFDGFGRRTFDATEFLLREGLAQVLRGAQPRWSSADSNRDGLRVTYHDACHLAHGQGVRHPPRALLEAIPGVSLEELGESDRCCGSAGVYNVTQPALARELLERKMEFIEATGASIVVSGNPGCHAWIAQGARERGRKVRVMHTLELLEAAFSGMPDE